MRKGIAAGAAVAAAVLLAGCGQTDVGSYAVESNDVHQSANPTASPSNAGGGSETPTSGDDATSGGEAKTVKVDIEGMSVHPNGELLKLDVGEPLVIEVEADHAGELHVHSTPEQELPYERGHTTLRLTIDKPGVVDVEDHKSDIVVFQLEVS
jgi:hypothetical protein